MQEDTNGRTLTATFTFSDILEEEDRDIQFQTSFQDFPAPVLQELTPSTMNIVSVTTWE